MAKYRILLLTKIVISLVCYSVIAQNSEDIADNVSHSTSDLIGKWYLVALVNRSPYLSPLMCIEDVINKEEGSDYLTSSVKGIFDGNAEYYEWKLNVSGSVLTQYHYYDGKYTKVTQDTFDIFPDKGMLIRYNDSEWAPYTIFSRKQNVEEKILSPYHLIAEENNWMMEYVNSNLCHLRSKNQEYYDMELSNNFHGDWLLVYEICPEKLLNFSIHSFTSINIKEAPNDDLTLTLHQVIDGKSVKEITREKVYDGHLHEVNNTLMDSSIHRMTFYNDNNEVLLRRIDAEWCDSIWSHQTYVSKETLKIYKSFAKEKGWKLIKV